MEDNQTPAYKPRHFFWFNIRIGSYTTIAFITFLSRVVPTTNLFCTIALVSYGIYQAVEVHKAAYQYQTSSRIEAIQKSFIHNAFDIALYFVSIIIGSLI